jgi:uncharacterized membrane protein
MLDGTLAAPKAPLQTSAKQLRGIMEKDRLIAFSDGVLAVVITIMVLELKAPREPSLAALAADAPTFLAYVLSFIYVGIYWNNHHHLFTLVSQVRGVVLWANLHLLFWLSLIPFTTSWLGEHPGSSAPAAIYGLSLLAPAIAYVVLQNLLITGEGRGDSELARALGRDLKGKLSPIVYLVGIGLSFVAPYIAEGLYLLVALVWLVPDSRIEHAVRAADGQE